MKFIILLCFVSFQALAFDHELSRAHGTKLPKKIFERIISLFEEEFGILAQRNGRVLEFYTDYEEVWAQGFARRWETDQVIIYGGLAALDGGNEDSFALTLCHEIGHLYGGPPFYNESSQLSAEGQSDYWATNFCFRKIAPKLSSRIPSLEALRFCDQENICARAVDAVLIVTAFYADNRSISHPEIATPDATRVQVTNLNHPEPQCRFDTFLSGIKGNSRPSCWFAK